MDRRESSRVSNAIVVSAPCARPGLFVQEFRVIACEITPFVEANRLRPIGKTIRGDRKANQGFSVGLSQLWTVYCRVNRTVMSDELSEVSA